MSDTAQDKVNQIAALIDAWRQNDSPEGEMSAGWVLGQIREVLGPVSLTEEEARRWAEGLLPDWKGARRILPGALMAASRGEIPPEVRKCHACGGSGSVGATGHDRDGFAHEQRCPVCTITPSEKTQTPIAAPIDPDSGTRETSIPEKPESSPPVAEMAVVLGTGDDAGPASEDLDANEENTK